MPGSMHDVISHTLLTVKQRQRPPMQLSPEDTKQPTGLDLELRGRQSVEVRSYQVRCTA